MLNQKIKTKQTFRKVVDRTTTEIITKHPRLFIIAIGFAITLIVGTAIGSVQVQNVHATMGDPGGENYTICTIAGFFC